MAQAARTFRVFVSSTFSDLKAERNALQKDVFPRLRDLCARHGCRFQAIDLRWGVREEAALDQQTMTICLDEIERCRTTSPRPNFIALLGDRYGWRPLPAQIEAGEFEAILEKVSEADRPFLLWSDRQPGDRKGWYRRDDNAVPPEYCLRPREVGVPDGASEEERKAAHESEEQEWRVVERRILAALVDAIDRLEWRPDDPRRTKYEASATEQEIVQGAMNVPDAPEHVFGFFRTIRDLPHDDTAGDFLDLDARGRLDEGAHTRQHTLKQTLRGLIPGSVCEYEAQWTGSSSTTDHIARLSDDVFVSLSRIIEQEIARLDTINPLDKEIGAHDTFGKTRRAVFVGRADALRSIGEYVASAGRNVLAVVGEPGSGKSALMARAAADCRSRNTDCVIVSRFVGVTPESSDVRALLDGVCRQISREYGADQDTVPSDYKELVAEFPKRLALATAGRPLMLFLDALDQLSDAQQARNLAWLTRSLPDHVRLVVSALPGDCETALRQASPRPQFLTLEKMTPIDGVTLLDHWLTSARRTLQPHQRQEVSGKFDRSGMPLYLKLAFEEARLWKSYTDRGQTALHEGIPDLIRGNLFRRLASPARHGRRLVSHSLGYLAASRYGLSEDELLDVLSADTDVLQDTVARARHEPPEQRLPVVVWSRLYFDLEAYLTERSADGTSLLAFYHNQLRQAAETEFLGGGDGLKRHRALATYFRDSADPAHDSTWAGGSPRGLSELPYHLTHEEGWDELHDTLTDFRFLERKAAEVGIVERTGARGDKTTIHAGPFLLQDDFDLALARMRDERGERRAVLDAFARVLSREVQTLSSRPHLFWQQLYNRLQWHGDPVKQVLAPELARRTGRGAAPWLRLKSRLRESEALVRTLAGHTGAVTACAISPDGTYIVSASNDQTLKLWDAASGRERATLAGHAGFVNGCAISPDASFIVSASSDHTLKLWDAATGRERIGLAGHLRFVSACAVSPDASFIVSASDDHTLKLWDVATGRERASLVGHTASVNACAISPDGTYVVSASDDKTLRLWDVATGLERATLVGHTGFVNGCAISADGRFIVSAAQDGILRLWDPDTHRPIATVDLGRSTLFSCAVSPDARTVVVTSGHELLSPRGENAVLVWDLADLQANEAPVSLHGHGGSVVSCAVAFDSSFIVSASDDRTLKVWDMKALPRRTRGAAAGGEVLGCAFTANGRMAVSKGEFNTLIVRDAETGVERAELTGHSGNIVTCAISASGRFVCSGGMDNMLFVWDTETGGRVVLAGHASWVYACAFSPDGGFVVSASSDGTLKVWDTATGKERATLRGHWRGVSACAVSPDGTVIVSGSADKTLKIWDVRTGEERATLEGHTDLVQACVIGPDASIIASSSQDMTLKIWAAREGVERASVHTNKNHRVHAISPDGRLLISAGNGQLVVRDVATGGERALIPLLSVPKCSAFDPARPSILSGDSGGSVYELDLVGIEYGPIAMPAATPANVAQTATPASPAGDRRRPRWAFWRRD